MNNKKKYSTQKNINYTLIVYLYLMLFKGKLKII